MKGHRSNNTGAPLPCVTCGEPSYSLGAHVCEKHRLERQRQQVRESHARSGRKYTAADKAGMKRWRQENFTKYLVGAARCRSKRLGVPFNITHEDVSVPETCPVLGIPLTTAESRERKDNLATLDRIVPALGYVKGNVAIISWRANFLKCNGTLGELRALVMWMQAVS